MAGTTVTVSNGAAVVRDYVTEIARGQVEGACLFRQIGRNPDVDNVREDVWESGGTYVFPAAGGIRMRVVSTDDNDTAAGTGERTVDIVYLDASGNELTERLTMNGTTPVLTTATDIWRIQDFHLRTAGSNALTVGTVSLTDTGGTVTYSSIAANAGRQRQAIITVPAGKIGFVNEIILSGNATGGAATDYLEGFFRATCEENGESLGAIFNFKAGVIQTNSSVWVQCNPIRIGSLCDIKVSVTSRAGTSSVVAVAGFSGWFEDE